MRREKKYKLTRTEYIDILEKLKSVMQSDENSNEQQFYTIKTIYLDNMYNKILNENIDGKRYREKFRIRMYNNNIEDIFLEKKINNNGVISKERERISKEEVDKIIEGNISLLNLETNLKKELYVAMKTLLLKPVMIIEYNRYAFVDKTLGIRITLDSNLYKSKNINEFFEIASKRMNEYILEVKYKDVFPKKIADCLKLNLPAISISKYKRMRLTR